MQTVKLTASTVLAAAGRAPAPCLQPPRPLSQFYLPQTRDAVGSYEDGAGVGVLSGVTPDTADPLTPSGPLALLVITTSLPIVVAAWAVARGKLDTKAGVVVDGAVRQGRALCTVDAHAVTCAVGNLAVLQRAADTGHQVQTLEIPVLGAPAYRTCRLSAENCAESMTCRPTQSPGLALAAPASPFVSPPAPGAVILERHHDRRAGSPCR